ncbi:MAG: FKBP-type peptidyl-prolyl cis-trans isomerase, partial [Bifidobacterium sp.]
MRTAAAVCTAAMCISLAACGGDDVKTSAGPQKLPQLTGVTAKGTPGKKPEISFKTPLSVENNATAVLQEGDGEALKNGDRLCLQLTQYSLKTGEEVATTWDTNVPDCSLVFNESDEPGSAESATLAQIANSTLKGKKINTTFGVGINDGSGDNQNYLLVATPVSQSKDLEKAEGKKVKDVPADLPKVTTATNGKPSIDMNGYKGSDKLVAQTLIEGNGPEITDDTYAAVVKYT